MPQFRLIRGEREARFPPGAGTGPRNTTRGQETRGLGNKEALSTVGRFHE